MWGRPMCDALQLQTWIHQQTFEHSPVGHVVTEVHDDGTVHVIDGNPAWERMLGIHGSRSRGRRLDDLLPTECGLSLVARHQECLRRGTPTEYLGAWVTSQGRRCFHIALTPIPDIAANGRRILCTARDVSTENRLRELAENLPDAVALYDLDCRRVYVNLALVRSAGVPAETLLGRRPSETMAAHPDEAQRYEDCIRSVMRSGQDATFGLKRIKAEGTQLDCQVCLVAERDASGSIAGVMAVGRDISALMETQRRLRSLIDGHPDIVVNFDSSGRIVDFSRRSLRRLGVATRNVIGKTMLEMRAPFGAKVHESVCRVVETGLPIVLELSIPVRDKLRYWELRQLPEIGAHGRVTGVLAIARDITDRHNSEFTIRELHMRRETDREEERRHIARELHDELGQYLTAIRMELSFVRMRWGPADPALCEKAEALQATVDQVIQIIRSLVSSLRPAVLDMGIAAALEWLVDEYGNRGDVAAHLHVDASCPDLDAQQTGIVFRIVQESLTNVAKHAGANRVDVRLERRGDHCVVMVRDDGCGFDPAARAEHSFGLVGMQERAQMLGGQLEIRSTPGVGTMISASFPMAPAAAAADLSPGGTVVQDHEFPSDPAGVHRDP